MEARCSIVCYTATGVSKEWNHQRRLHPYLEEFPIIKLQRQLNNGHVDLIMKQQSSER